MGCFTRPWKALMRRNMIYFRRNWISTILELLLPVGFVYILVAIKISTESNGSLATEVIEATFPSVAITPLSFNDYVTAIRAQKQCIDIGNGEFEISGIRDKGDNWQVPLIKCDSRLCTENNTDATPYCEYMIVALAGTGGGVERANAFKTWVETSYPSIVSTTAEDSGMPFDYPLFKVFDSPTAINTYIEADNYGNVGTPKVAMGIVWDGNDSNQWSYQLRPNSTNYNAPEMESDTRPTARTTPATDVFVNNYARDDASSCSGGDGGEPNQGDFGFSCTGLYIYNGVLTFQRLVHDFILDQSGAADLGYAVAEAGVQFAPFPTKPYESSGFYDTIQGLGAFLIVLGLLYPVSSMLSYIVKEKELRQKELMKMMSVSESDINWSWFATFMLLHFCTATLTAVVSAQLYTKSTFIMLWIFWLLVFIAMVVFCMAIAALTAKTTQAVMIGLLLFLSGYILTTVFSHEERSIGLVQLVSLHPVAAFSYGVNQIAQLESDSVGLTFDSMDFSENKSGYSFRNTLNMLMIDCIVWGGLCWYLNRVIKPDYGQANPWYFPFTTSYWFPSKLHLAMSESTVVDKVAASGIPYEPVSEALKRQSVEGKSIEIHNLRKDFGDKTAVDGLNLSMYNGQITALLGHNGAGKTTTISMLTGAMGPTDGYATIAGKDIRTDLLSIRQSIGICLQHDCLFPNLTVREHVQFFSRLKGLYDKMSRAEADEHVDQSIRDVALFEKRNSMSKNLSGGMKRKLSVAIAFCGNSEVVLLDEPTSGMDPFSRRFTWNVIRQYRKDRCIILTTHFMDEADILGDRIAIMAEGRLRCAGSALFLKKHYGVGYQLTIEKPPVSNRKMEKYLAATSTSNDSSEITEGYDGSLHWDRSVVPRNNFREVTDYDETIASSYSEDFYDDEDDSAAHLKHLIKSAVPNATLLNDVGTEVRYQLPLGASDQFAAMFESLDRETDMGNVVSYGVSMTTLDEVFLLVARGDSTEENKSRLASSRALGANGINEDDADRSVRSRMDLQKDVFFGRHVAALLKKRAFNFQRDKKAWCFTTITPVIFVTIGFFVFSFASPERNLSPLTLDLSKFNPDVKTTPINLVPVNSPKNPFPCQPSTCAYDPIVSVDATGETYAFCGTQGNLGSADITELLGSPPAVTNNLCTVRDSSAIIETLNGFQTATVVESFVDGIENASYSLYNSSTNQQSSQYGAIWFTREPDSPIVNSNTTISDSIQTLCETVIASGMLDYTTETDCARLRNGYGYVIHYNHTGLHSAPLYQALADQALARHALNNPDVTITATIAPLPITKIEQGLGAAEDTFVAWFLVLLGFPFIAGAYASFIVVERESKAKHLQTVAGVEPAAYWISTFLWDTINYQIPLWIVVAELFIFDVNSLTTSERDMFSGIVTLLLFYGPANAGFAYCWSFAFSSPSLCNIILIVTGFLIGFAAPLTIFILTLLGEDRSNPNDNLVTIANILTWILRFVPSFNLGKGLFYAINVELVASLEQNMDLSVWSEPVLLVEVIYLIAQTVVYTGLAIMLDIWSTNPQAMAVWNNIVGLLKCNFCIGGNTPEMDITVALPEDDDVIAEQNRVLSGDANDDLIVVSQLSKIYSNGKKAVNNMSLGIPPGQCFGLLGINGAGKTTTMGILTAEFPPSCGDATLAGFSITKEPQKIRRRIGYCPQFDAHFANLSGRNHVELYASIKGVPAQFVKEAAAMKLKEVGLSEYDSDRLCSNYSGGMKRRLSLACATIGQPQIVFLDECSTGVDPVARREIWQLVSDMVTGGSGNNSIPEQDRTSVILTTHSMEECEALCPRIGIMANGRLRCLGSAQHLKNKFGQGFQVELKTKVAERNDDDYIQNKRVLASLLLERGDEEALATTGEDLALNKDQTLKALRMLTNDEFLEEMISLEHPTGAGVYRDCTSPGGVSVDTLAAFATGELRMRTVEQFMSTQFPGYVLRERQDTKARYEVSANGTRISSIFEIIESNKEGLRLADYGVSQTSLEQVFNMHAAEAEKLKQGRDDH